MYKRALIMLLVVGSAMASPKREVDTVQYSPITANVISANAIGGVIIDSISLDREWWWPPDTRRARDTANWYIESIGEKCDTTYKLIYAPAIDANIDTGQTLYKQFYERTIECKIDTAWAEKITPRLTETQWQKLLQLLER